MAPAHKRLKNAHAVKGVRIACVGERVAGIEGLTDYNIPTDHDVFTEGEPSQVSELIGMPLFVSRVRPSMKYAAMRHSFGYDLSSSHHPNPATEQLMMCCDEKRAEDLEGDLALLGTPTRWSKGVGSVVVVRKDRKPLHAHHVRAILKFIETNKEWAATNLYHANVPLDFKDNFETKPTKPKKLPNGDQIIAQFTPGDFKDFYMKERRFWEWDNNYVHLLELPSPWTPGNTRLELAYWQLEYAKIKHADDFKNPKQSFIQPSRHKLARHAYTEMTFHEKLRNTQSYAEYVLLREIAALKWQHGEGPHIVVIYHGDRATCPDKEGRHPIYTECRPNGYGSWSTGRGMEPQCQS